MNRIAHLTLPLMTLTLLASGGSALADHDTAHWGYSGAAGPEHWGELDPLYSACRSGTLQTPIDLTGFVQGQLPPIEFHYQPSKGEEIDNGHTIQIAEESGGEIVIDGHAYTLKQYHFHAPSENHIDGKAFPMEAHLVHADADGNLAVIAVLFEEGDENAALTAPWAVMPEQVGDQTPLAATSPEGLLPAHRDYYRFNGSLTTPPCTEGVAWLVMKEPVTASAAQIAKFASVMGHPNNRPIQPRNGRAIVE